jgi:hypothetical protein
MSEQLKRYGIQITESGRQWYQPDANGDVNLFTREEAEQMVKTLRELKLKSEIKTDAKFIIVQLY